MSATDDPAVGGEGVQTAVETGTSHIEGLGEFANTAGELYDAVLVAMSEQVSPQL